MKDLDVLELFINEIESIVNVPVRMSNNDSEHEPDMVLLDNLSTRRELRSTNPYIGLAKDDAENVIGEKLQFYFNARLDITTTSEQEVTAYNLRQDIVDHFRLYERNPKDLHDEVVLFELGNGGNRETEFEPTVFRLFKQTQAFHLEFTDTVEVTADVLEQIQDETTIN